MSKKVLCVCNYGEVRSVTLCKLIKNMNGINERDSSAKDLKYQAVAIGMQSANPELRRVLIDWADYVVDLSDSFCSDGNETLRNESGNKYVKCETVGLDKWGNPHNSELISLLNKFISEWGWLK